jgi:hypothetical protein
VSRRKTNRRHMTGDHHGWTARRATLQVTATDEILGTHTATGAALSLLRGHNSSRHVLTMLRVSCGFRFSGLTGRVVYSGKAYSTRASPRDY